jgi:hypothetical protein
VISEKEGDGSWSWRLPDQASKGIADTPASGDDPLDPLDSLPIDKGDEPDHQGDQVSPLPPKGIRQEDQVDPLGAAGEIPLSTRVSEGTDEQEDQGDHGLEDELPDEERPWLRHPLGCLCEPCGKYWR